VGFDARAGIARDDIAKPDGDGTLLTLMHEQFFDEEARDKHQMGWIGCLDKLETFMGMN